MTGDTCKRNEIEKRRRDFGLVDRALERGAVDFVEFVGVSAGARVLDLGCGTGNCSIAAAKLGGDVTGVDAREPFLSRGRAWAKNAGLLIRFQNAGGPKLPFSDNSFELGVSFLSLHAAQDPAAELRELARVVRDDGRIAVALWSERSPVAAMLRTAYQYCGDGDLERALQWLDPSMARAALPSGGDGFDTLDRRLEIVFPLPADAVADTYLTHHPLLSAALEGLPAEERRHLAAEIGELLTEIDSESTEETRFRADYRLLLRR